MPENNEADKSFQKRLDDVEAAARTGKPFPFSRKDLTAEEFDYLKVIDEEIRDALSQPNDDLARDRELFATTPYELSGFLGEGSFGKVYRGRRIQLGHYAIKILDSDFERCITEGQAASAIDNDFIVKVHDYGRLPDNRMYLVMDLVEGELDESSLRTYIKDASRRPPEEKILRWMKEICEGMIAAAEAGITHRDLKPSNILIDIGKNKEGRARICDFGLARFANTADPSPGLPDGEKDENNPSGTSAGKPGGTHTGSEILYKSQAHSFEGSLAYAAPEQIREARKANEQSDIYSFGATFYHLLDGEPPTGDLTRKEIIELKTRPITSSAWKNILIGVHKNPRVPRIKTPDLSDLIMLCLSNDPDERPKSFKHLRRMLNKIEAPLTRRNPYYDELLAMGREAINEGRYRRARNYFSKAIGFADNSAEARCGRGEASLLIDELKEAHKDLTRAIELNPQYHQAYQLLGDVYVRLGKLEKAEETYQIAKTLRTYGSAEVQSLFSIKPRSRWPSLTSWQAVHEPERQQDEPERQQDEPERQQDEPERQQDEPERQQDEHPLVATINSVPAAVWVELSGETTLTGVEQGQSYSLGVIAENPSRKPSAGQSIQGCRILLLALKFGYQNDALTLDLIMDLNKYNPEEKE